MITRILPIGPSRINEAAITLSFDYNLNPIPDITYIISPYPQHKLDSVFAEFGLNSSNYNLIDDLYFEKFYDLSRYKHHHWYYQQALKFCAFDHFDSDYFLLQDMSKKIQVAYKILKIQYNILKKNYKNLRWIIVAKKKYCIEPLYKKFGFYPASKKSILSIINKPSKKRINTSFIETKI